MARSRHRFDEPDPHAEIRARYGKPTDRRRCSRCGRWIAPADARKSCSGSDEHAHALPKPEPVAPSPPPVAVYATQSQSASLTAGEEKAIRAAFPGNLDAATADALLDAVRIAIGRYRAHRVLFDAWADTPALARDLAALEGAAAAFVAVLSRLETDEHGSARGWLAWIDADTADALHVAFEAAERAWHLATVGQKYLEESEGVPGVPRNVPLFTVARAFADEWHRITGRGLRSDTFAWTLQAWARVATGNPEFDGAKLAREVAESRAAGAKLAGGVTEPPDSTTVKNS